MENHQAEFWEKYHLERRMEFRRTYPERVLKTIVWIPVAFAVGVLVLCCLPLLMGFKENRWPKGVIKWK